jgi:glycosyltransferase involved in cell wall biosynthesis
VRVVHLSTLHRALDVRIFYKECRTLAARGHEVHLVAPDPPGPARDGVVFHPVEPPTAVARPLRVARRLAAVYRQAAALRADVYHFHDPELIPVGLLLKRGGARVLYDVHEDSPREAVALNRGRPWRGRLRSAALALLEGAARHALDAFVCATPEIGRRFPPRRTVTVRNYPLLEESAPVPAELGAPYRLRPPHLAYVGGLTAIRGAREMVGAVGCLPEGLGARLLLAGRFDSPELRAEVVRLPGWDRVDFLGWQSRRDVRAVLARARVGLVMLHPEPIYLDAQPTKLFEYMAAGLPVIASDFPAWRRLIGDVGCGLFVDPLDAGAIARAAAALLARPEEAEEMGRRGRRAVRERFHWEREASGLLGLYRQLQRPGPPAGALPVRRHGEAA